MNRTKLLGYSALIMGIVGVAGIAVVLFGSLRPSARSQAVYSQGRFPAAMLEDLNPGEIRFVRTGLGSFYIVVPTYDMRADLDLAADHAVHRWYHTLDEDLDAFVVWSIPPKKEGARCGVMHMEKNSDANGIEKYGGFFDPCSGTQFDYAGRVSLATHQNNVRNLKRPEFRRVSSDEYQITNLDHLFRELP